MFQSSIVVDERERKSRVPNILQSLGLKIVYTTLDIGDYVMVTGYVVERKAVRDFVNSLFSGRLFEQANRLTETYKEPIIVVEGNLQDLVDTLPNPRAIWGAMITLSFTYGARIFFTGDQKQTADFLYTLTKREGDQTVKPRIYKKIRSRTMDEMSLVILANLPGIGPKLAERMLCNFGTARKALTASVSEMTKIEGIGRTKAERIATILDSTFGSESTNSQSRLAT